MSAAWSTTYGRLLAKIALDSRWVGKDSFPSDQLWADEVENWLMYIESKNQFERFLPRLKDLPAKRDETMAEIKAAYFIERYAGYPITSWEPIGQDEKKVEFAFPVKGAKVFCEVKSPGWERAIVESQGINSVRLRQTKYIPGVEVSSFANWPDVRSSILKASPKFRSDTRNLLVLVDDLRVSLCDDPLGVPRALYETNAGCFATGQYSNLGAVAVLNVKNAGKIEYFFRVYHNPMANIRVRLREEIFANYEQLSGCN